MIVRKSRQIQACRSTSHSGPSLGPAAKFLTRSGSISTYVRWIFFIVDTSVVALYPKCSPEYAASELQGQGFGVGGACSHGYMGYQIPDLAMVTSEPKIIKLYSSP